MRTSSYIQVLAAAAVLLASPAALAQKVYLSPSDQDTNPVSGGGNEAQYALINARIAEGLLDSNGFDYRVDQDFHNAPANANSWGVNIFVSIHTNAVADTGSRRCTTPAAPPPSSARSRTACSARCPTRAAG